MLNPLLLHNLHLVGTVHGTDPTTLSIMHPNAVPDFFRRYEKLLVKPNTLIISETIQGTYENSTGLYCYLPTSRNYTSMLSRVLGKDYPQRVRASIAFADDRNTKGSYSFFASYAVLPLVEKLIEAQVLTIHTQDLNLGNNYGKTISKQEVFEYVIHPAKVVEKSLKEHCTIDYAKIASIIKQHADFSYLKMKSNEMGNQGPEEAVLRCINRYKDVFSQFIIVCGAGHSKNLHQHLGIEQNIILPDQLTMYDSLNIPGLETLEAKILFTLLIFSEYFYEKIEGHM